MDHKITILPQNITINVGHGTNLLQAMRSAGTAPDAPCGGNGKCGKCTAIVDGREVLTCSYTVESDVTVNLKRSDKVQIPKKRF